MSFISRARHLYRRLSDPDRADAELDTEVRSYFDEIVDRHVGRGLTLEEARRAARLEFEGIEQVKERVREARMAISLETVFSDTRYALRALRKNPGFAAVAVLVLALGIGASTAIFSVVNAVLLRPLPYRNPVRLVAVSGEVLQGGRLAPNRLVSLNEVEAWRRLSASLESIGSFVFTALPLSVGDQSMFPVAIGADQELLTTLGVEPELGHNFSNPGSSHADFSVIISHNLWTGPFHSDPAVIGRSIALDGAPYTVVGVLPAAFQFPRSDAAYFPEQPDLLFPVANIAEGWGRDSTQWFAIGRLKPGISLAQADSELKALTPRISRQTGRTARLTMLDAETTSAVRTPLLLLFGVSIVLLVIACTNIMNLLFARAPARRREIAIRIASGATRWRLIRQILTESFCLTILGGILGLALAWSVAGILIRISPAYLPVSGRVSIDLPVFAFAFAVCAAAALFAGLFPALRMALDRANLFGRLGSRDFGGRALARFQHTLTVVQVALGFALLATAGVLTHSLIRLASVDPGFRSDGIVGFEFAIPTDHSQARSRQVIQSMLETARATPGVLSAGTITFLPPETRAGAFTRFFAPGVQTPVFSNSQITSEDYFKTVGVPVLRGRDFTSADSENAPRVAIVNETFARRYFSRADALGRRIAPYDPRNSPHEIIGIVRDMHDRGLNVNPVATVYLPYRQSPRAYGAIAVHTSLPPETLIPELRTRVARVDATAPVKNFATIGERLHKTLDEPRFYALLAGACGIMAVLFVTLGLYGVVSYSVSRRTPEIGVRMALGASRPAILRRVLRQGLWMAFIGVAAGLALSLAASKFLVNLLFQVKPNDPPTLALAAALVLAVTLLASFIPARRASRVDPIVALRHE